MAVRADAFDVYVFVPKAGSAPPWRPRRWEGIAAALGPLVDAVEHPVRVRSTQLEGRGGALEPVPFGDLGWNCSSHAEWTFDEASSPEATRVFVSVEAWAPDWESCAARDAAPDFFFTIQHEVAPPLGAEDGATALLLAVAASLPAATLDVARRAALGIAEACEAATTVHRRRTWDASAKSGSAEAVPELLSRVGPRFAATLRRGWKRL